MKRFNLTKKILGYVRAALFFLLLFPLFVSLLDTPKPQEEQELQFKKDEVIVKFKPGSLDQLKRDLRDGDGLRKVLFTNVGNRGVPAFASDEAKEDEVLIKEKDGDGAIVKIKLPEGVSVEEAVEELEESPEVEFAEPNYKVYAVYTPNDPFYSSSGSWGQDYDDLWGITKIHSNAAWNINTGSSTVVVAVIDTGLDRSHEDIADNVWSNSGEIAGNGIDDDGNGYIDDVYGWDFINGDNDPTDDHGHGTHVAGTVAGVGDNNKGVVGVTFSSEIMGLKFLSGSGSGYVSDAISAINYAVANGAHILSNSWAGYGTSSSLQSAINDAADAGLIIIAAAANSNTNVAYYYPANMNNVVAVAATGTTDTKASFSNYGTLVDLSAPGVDTLSLRAAGTSMGTPIDANYTRASGTSMAAPHVSGLAALIWAQNPTWTDTQVISQMQTYADDIDSLNPSYEGLLGSGRINSCRSLASLSLISLTLDTSQIAGDVFQVTVTGSASGGGSSDFSGPVAFTSSDSQAALPTDDETTWSAASKTFSVTLNTIGSQTITVSGCGISKTSQTITVNSSGVTSYEVTPTVATNVDADTHSITVTAQAKDTLGNNVAESGINVNWSVTNGGEFSSETTQTNASGLAQNTLTTSTVSSTTHVVTATDEDSNTGQSATVTITPGALNTFTFADIGQQIKNTYYTITITAKDQYGNKVTSFSGTAALSVNKGAIQSEGDVVFSGGEFSGRVRVTSAQVDVQITATYDSVSGSSNLFNITSQEIASLEVAPTTVESVSADTHSVAVTAQAKDASGSNVAQSGIIVSWTVTNGGSFSSSTSQTDSTGLASNTLTTSTVTSTTHIVTATDEYGNTGQSATVTVTLGTLSNFTFAHVGHQKTDTYFTVTITARDQYGNKVTSFLKTATLSTNKGTLQSEGNATFSNGEFSGRIKVTSAQSNVQITATYDSAAGGSNLFDVTAPATSTTEDDDEDGSDSDASSDDDDDDSGGGDEEDDDDDDSGGGSSDINSDGRVNIFDLSVLLSNFGGGSSSADLNGDGRTDIFDLSILLSQWTG